MSLSTTASSRSSVELVADNLDKPVTDDRQYRVIRLRNKLEVLLASDPNVDMASAALDVNVGSFRDGGIPGLAHAVEHLLFMGSKKYPADNDFKSFIGSHSGASNASTSPCSTTYHFQITAADFKSGDGLSKSDKTSSNKTTPSEEAPSPFYGALDRFSQFFTSPLFLASTVDREINAVDSEFKLKYQSDDRRLYQLSRSLSNSEHPYHGFSTGNLSTLRDEPAKESIDMRAKFVDFHSAHYSANRMKLCVLGKEPLDTLQEWVVEMFSDIPNKDLPQNRWEHIPLWAEEQLPRRIYTKPIMDLRWLRVQFPFLDEEFLYENRPGNYLSKLIAHKGKGSLLAYLKNQSLATSVSADVSSICPGTPGVLTVEVGMTEEGLEKHEDITKAIFQYISILRDDPSKLEGFVLESRHLEDLFFYYRQKSESRTFTSSTVKRMQTQVPPKWYIGIGNRSKTYDLTLMTKGLELLQPDRARITLISQKYPGTWEAKEKWYGTEYTEQALPDDFLSELRRVSSSKTRPAELHLPAANPFIPANLDIDQTANTLPSPRLLTPKDHAAVRSWYKKDDTFLVPKAVIYVTLHSPLLFITANNEAHADLLTDLVTDALQEYSYAASLAGLHYSVELGTRGFVVCVHGYNDKLPLLLDRVIATLLRDLDIREDRVAIFKERLLRVYSNSELRKPCIQIPAYQPWLLSADTPPRRLDRQLAPSLQAATVDSLRGFRDQIAHKLYIEMYSHGNVTREEAGKITQILEDNLTASRPAPQHVPTTLETQKDVTEDVASKIKTEEDTALRNIELLIPRALVIPRGVNFRYAETIRDPGDVNNCISYHIQLGPPEPASPTLRRQSSPKTEQNADITSKDDNEHPEVAALRALRAKLQLICHIIRPRVFHQLRTTEQLGYVIRTRLTASPGARGSRVSGFAIEVQSEKSPEYLEQRIDAFLARLAGPVEQAVEGALGDDSKKSEIVLDGMTEVAFEAEKKGVVDKMLEKPKNLTQEGDRFWDKIRDESYDFEQAERDAEHVMAITKQDLIEFIRHYIAPTSPHRSTLAIYLRSHRNAQFPGTESEGQQSSAAPTTRRIEITDIRDFKASLVADVGPRPVRAIETYYYTE